MSASRPSSSKIQRLKLRAEFLRAGASRKRVTTPGFVLQAAEEKKGVRFGLTATKKLGNAVIRNRARRRLRALAEKVLAQQALPGDYVLVARDGALELPLPELEKDLARALQKLSCLK